MHFHLPKPMHGWREFVGEIAIIVIGVLIALGAEQLVEVVHWRGEVADARKALDAELAHSVGAFEYRLGQSQCIDRRLLELDAWLRDWKRGKHDALEGPIGRIPGFEIWTSVWDVTQSGQVASHIPLAERLAYSRIYDLLKNFESLRNLERDAWYVLRDYDQADELDHQDMIRLRGALSRAKYLNRVIGQNAHSGYILDTARRLSIRPARIPMIDEEAEKILCQPIPRRRAQTAPPS